MYSLSKDIHFTVLRETFDHFSSCAREKLLGNLKSDLSKVSTAELHFS